jgi:hypothetical protein
MVQSSTPTGVEQLGYMNVHIPITIPHNEAMLRSGRAMERLSNLEEQEMHDTWEEHIKSEILQFGVDCSSVGYKI